MIVDLEIHSKPQEIFKHLVKRDTTLIVETYRNKKLFKKLGLRNEV